MRKNSYGFTLIELIIVIVILGILGAIAIPRFIDLKTSANLSVLQSLEGSILSVAHQVNIQANLEGVATVRNGTIDFNGLSVRTRWGYPRTNQIFSTPGNTRLIDADISDARITANIVRLDNNNNCRIRYRHPTASSQLPRIDMRTNGC